MSQFISIYKILPTGRMVWREVTPTEYSNDGWFRNGWVADPRQINAARLANEGRERAAIWGGSIKRLARLARFLIIKKKLNNGRWARRRVRGGEYHYEGWQRNGWIVPRYNNRENYKPPEDTLGNRKRLFNSIIRRQNWWRSTLSRDQAEAIYRPLTREINEELGHDTRADIARLQSGLFVVNEEWERWLQRARRWAAQRHRRLYRQTLYGTPQQRHAALVEIYKLYNQRVRAPEKIRLRK